jgi:heptosyltransferase III
MRRYLGPENLPAKPRVAVIANDAIGNFVVATPLLQMLVPELAPSFLMYFGGTRTAEYEAASDLFDAHFPLHGTDPAEALAKAPRNFDLIVNVENSTFAKAFAAFLAGPETQLCGPCLGSRGDIPFPEDPRGDLWRDKEWVAEDLSARYPFLSSGYIAEIYARLAYLEGEVPRYRLPKQPVSDVPDVLIAASASLPDKLWPYEKWAEILSQIGRSVGLLGAPPAAQKQYWKGNSLEDDLVAQGLVHDLRGKFTLPQVTGALASAKLVLTLDNGILHVACATSTPVVGLFRYGIHRLWAPPVPNLSVLTPAPDQIVSDIPVETVLEAVRLAL